jgi:hypothetical protein
MVCICWLLAALIAAAGAGRNRAFAAGFLIASAFYLLAWQAASKNWLGLNEDDLLTVRVVDRFYDLVKRPVSTPATPAGGVSPATPAGSTGGTTPVEGDTATQSFGTDSSGDYYVYSSYFGAVPKPTFAPYIGTFQKIAHWQIAFYVGLAGGLFARGLWSKRSAD